MCAKWSAGAAGHKRRAVVSFPLFFVAFIMRVKRFLPSWRSLTLPVQKEIDKRIIKPLGAAFVSSGQENNEYPFQDEDKSYYKGE